MFLLTGMLFGVPIVIDFFKTGLVPRLPTAVLSSALILLSGMSVTIGLILDTLVKHEQKRYELWLKR